MSRAPTRTCLFNIIIDPFHIFVTVLIRMHSLRAIYICVKNYMNELKSGHLLPSSPSLCEYNSTTILYRDFFQKEEHMQFM